MWEQANFLRSGVCLVNLVATAAPRLDVRGEGFALVRSFLFCGRLCSL